MRVPVLDLEVVCGEDWTQRLRWRDQQDDGTVVAMPVLGWSGWTGRMDVRDAGDVSPTPAGAVRVALTTGASSIVLGPATGDIALVLTNAQTAALEPTADGAPYVYDLELVDGTGKVTKLCRGEVVVIAEVTRP